MPLESGIFGRDGVKHTGNTMRNIVPHHILDKKRGKVNTNNREKQKEQIQEKINELNKEKTMSSEEKEKAIQTYQAQIQTIDARIQQIKQKQAEAEKNNAQQQAPTDKDPAAQAAAPAKPLTRGNVDIEI